LLLDVPPLAPVRSALLDRTLRESGYVFTKEEISCDWFEMLRFVHAGDRIFASS
jgi:hypothetical protein